MLARVTSAAHAARAVTSRVRASTRRTRRSVPEPSVSSSSSSQLTTLPLHRGATTVASSSASNATDWIVVGCDSDANGALCVISGRAVGEIASVRVVDNPTSVVEVNGRSRVRLDPDAMREATASLGVPKGTRVYLEEGGVEFGFSAQTAFVQGYNFGLWRGVFAAAELDVKIVKPQAWKAAMGLKFKGSTKDDSIAMAKMLFPEVASELSRKRDHGRAESLLIAAYGHVADGAMRAEEEDELCSRVRAALADRGLVREEGAALPYFGPYFGMTGNELKKELKARSLKVSGTKTELILRLEESDEQSKASQSKSSATA
jgi:hypothetical protein